MTLITLYGGSDSNSYIDITQADSFITTSIFDSSSWTDLSSVQKGAAILQATQDVDSRQYIGGRFNSEQLLEFPRQVRSSFPYNRVGTELTTEDAIQLRMRQDVQQATAHQALKIARDGGRNVHIENVKNNIVGISESVGPIREFVQYGQKSAVGNMRLSTESLTLLQDWWPGMKIFRA